MSSSGLIYAVIVGAWAAYLVPMWLRRQDELNEARPTERFSTAIRLLSGRAGMERRYAKDLQARSASEDETGAAPDGVTDSVDVRAFAVSSTEKMRTDFPDADEDGEPSRGESGPGSGAVVRRRAAAAGPRGAGGSAHRVSAAERSGGSAVSAHLGAEQPPGAGHPEPRHPGRPGPEHGIRSGRPPSAHAEGRPGGPREEARPDAEQHGRSAAERPGRTAAENPGRPASEAPGRAASERLGRAGADHGAGTRPVPRQAEAGQDGAQDRGEVAQGSQRTSALPPSARAVSAAAEAARAQRSKVLARRRRTTVVLFLAFTLGAVVAAVGGLAFLWAPAAPALLLSAYIAYLRRQERRRFTYTMDRRRAEDAARRLRERERQPRRHSADDPAADDAEDGPEPAPDPELSALAADRRALVEQTDHAEWVDQQRDRRGGPANGENWDPVPVPLPTYVTAPVAPRAASGLESGAADAWSSDRSSTARPSTDGGSDEAVASRDDDPVQADLDDGQCDARRAASARRARERGHTPLFDQYADGGRPRAANE